MIYALACMEIDSEVIYDFLVMDDIKGLQSFVDSTLKKNIKSKEDWRNFVGALQKASLEIYQKHWLKTNHIILAIFGMPELLGVDCNLFDELRSLEKPEDISHASIILFDRIVESARNQLRSGGSTLFFDVAGISSTRSAIITSDLIQARYRETILVLSEIDEKLPTLTKEWVDVSRLWKTGNGFRLLKARNLGVHIHIKEYIEIRALLLTEMKVNPNRLTEVRANLIDETGSNYLQLSKTLDEFVSGLIASRGIRGSFDPYYKTWINHEGLDEF